MVASSNATRCCFALRRFLTVSYNSSRVSRAGTVAFKSKVLASWRCGSSALLTVTSPRRRSQICTSIGRPLKCSMRCATVVDAQAVFVAQLFFAAASEDTDLAVW